MQRPPRDADRGDFRSRMTSPVEDFELFENEDEILGDTTVRQEEYEEDEDGEELFGDNMEKLVLLNNARTQNLIALRLQ